jgi:hypothetical protein
MPQARNREQELLPFGIFVWGVAIFSNQRDLPRSIIPSARYHEREFLPERGHSADHAREPDAC